MNEILKKIVNRKKKELEISKLKCSIKSLKKLIPNKKKRTFKDLLKYSQKNKVNNIIAETKKSSPSAGEIIKNYYPEDIATEYEKSGIECISVLTENFFFNGHLDHISIIHNKTNLSILRKDFIIDAYQVYESKVFKADAILLIASILTDNEIKNFINIAEDIGLDCIIETHSEEELNRAIKINYPIIGINNRNLDTLSIDISNTLNLSKKISNDFIVIAESGIKKFNDIHKYNQSGIYNFLIGEIILRSENKKQKIKELLNL